MSAPRAVRELENIITDLRRQVADGNAIIASLNGGPDKVLRCAFCGEPYPYGTPTHKSDALAAHIRVCKLHPVGIENRELGTALEKARAALHGIHDTAHCIAKAGPLNTPTLDVAWGKFNLIATLAVDGLSKSSPRNDLKLKT